MSASFAYEDPLMRQSLTTAQKTSEIFKEMGRGMWRSGKGFGKVGALFAGIECVIESVSANEDCFGLHLVFVTDPTASSIAHGTIWSTQSRPDLLQVAF